LAEIAQRLGRKALEVLAAVAKPDTLLAWYRKLIANKFDGSRIRQRVSRPRMDEEAERLVVQIAKENPIWVSLAKSRNTLEMKDMRKGL
jgi:putative transposase